MYLYWIRHTSHTDIKNQGYVGVTRRSLKQRFYEHSISTNPHLKNAFKKYNQSEIIIEKIFEASEHMCLFIEHQLRPVKEIGWNIVPGGGLPPKTKGKKLNLSKEKREARSKRVKGINNPMYGKKSIKSQETLEKMKNIQLILAKEGKHEFQKKEVREYNSKRQKRLAQLNLHPSQTPEYKELKRKECIERNKTDTMKRLTQERNRKMNSTQHTCPHCLKQGKGPNMKRYHFDNCKKYHATS